MLHKLLTEHRGVTSCVDQTSTSSISESWPANTLSLAPTSTPPVPKRPAPTLTTRTGAGSRNWSPPALSNSAVRSSPTTTRVRMRAPSSS
ncbi:hypothetical protein B0H17DRAFT_1070019 [Mycena rosella]|uniref:Uncharacterized protein n=1 Tax=Mycena rosella TaxID=1033263 RepID=A0AAD7DCR4_MYCRO|nr:hypothetical protein B0H17DRAFT_1070019 [Mycena rosella]